MSMDGKTSINGGFKTESGKRHEKYMSATCPLCMYALRDCVSVSVLIRGGTGSVFCRVPDPGNRPLLPGRIRVVAGSGYLIM